MNIEYELTQLTELARKDKALRERILATKNSEDSLKSFCEICNEIGFSKITIYEMSTLGEQFCAAMLRSVNGGGVEAPDVWDDCYELLMYAAILAENKKGGLYNLAVWFICNGVYMQDIRTSIINFSAKWCTF